MKHLQSIIVNLKTSSGCKSMQDGTAKHNQAHTAISWIHPSIYSSSIRSQWAGISPRIHWAQWKHPDRFVLTETAGNLFSSADCFLFGFFKDKFSD